MRRYRWLPWVVASVLVLLLADAAIWLAAERAMTSGIAGWVADLRTNGISVSTGPATWGGFPLAATRRFALSLRAGATTVQSGQVIVGLSPARPDRVRVQLPMPVLLASPMLPGLTLASPDWRLDLLLDGSGIATTDARELSLEYPGPGAGPRVATIALVHLQTQPSRRSLELTGSAQSIALPTPLPSEIWPLGRRLASVAFDAVLSGRPPFLPILASSADAPSLAAWRDSGGAVDIRRLALGYGPLGLSGSGRAELDSRLQPIGTAELTLLGYAETLDTLVAAHLLDAHAAQAAGAVLSLLAGPPAGGGSPQVTLAVRLRGGVLSAAGFPLLRVPDVTWPGAPR